LQHSKFAAALHLFDLFEPDGDERYYAPWRQPVPRSAPAPHPAGGDAGLATWLTAPAP
jgi:hypothetical protein